MDINDQIQGMEGSSDKIHNMTMEEMQNASDDELLAMVEKAAGHTKDFSTFLHTDFSYTTLTGELKKRGYQNGWYRNPDVEGKKHVDVIQMKAPKSTRRVALSMSDEVADAWQQFNKNVPYRSVTIDEACRRFMRDYAEGKISFTLSI